ncbi:MAG: hypothetical protein MSC30_14745 [Gaiellaceae bacterium MAG52_C11]|nr:hypothetical protein [Candidatus Gaiellasilicea maunaloa]
MSRLRGLLDRQNEASDVESERAALQRQRLEAAAEIESLKAVLSDRVAHVQDRERELDQALARVEKREQALAAATAKSPRLKAVGSWLAEAQAARAARSDEKERATVEELCSELAAVRATLALREQELAQAKEQPPAGPAIDGDRASEPDASETRQAAAKALAARAEELDARVAELDAREARLAETEAAHSEVDSSLATASDNAGEHELTAGRAALESGEAVLAAREAGLDRRAEELSALERALADRDSALFEQEQARADEHDEAARGEARLEELRSAELAFVRTRSELAARSDALAERELQLAARERAVVARETPPTPELDALETRIRRLEQSGRGRRETTQTFSAGLRALQDRGVRAPVDDRNEPLH